MQDIIFYPKNSFIQQCCCNCKSSLFNCIRIPIYTSGMYYTINVCENENCIEKCMIDLDIFFNNNERIYIIFYNLFIEDMKEDQLIKINVPRSNGTISSWYCSGCKNDFSSFLVYEKLSSSSLSKSVKYENLKELNNDDIFLNLKSMKVMILENIKLNILKNNKKMYDEYILLSHMKNQHKNKMKNIISEIEYLPLLGIKYIYDFENIHKPNHNKKMKYIIHEIESFPPFNNFTGGIEYLKAKEFFENFK